MAFGKGTLMAKFDIRRAYRLIPIHEDDRLFLGLRWKGQYYIDLALPFGLRSAPQFLSRFADVLEFLLSKEASVQYIQHYLDDFFIAGKPDSDECDSALTNCIRV